MWLQLENQFLMGGIVVEEGVSSSILSECKLVYQLRVKHDTPTGAPPPDCCTP